MIKAAIACLAMMPVVASAWESPQQAVDQFVSWELDGGRLKTDNEGMERHVHLEPDHDGIGADTVLLSDSHRMGKLRCKAGRCQVTVTYHLPPMETNDRYPLGNGPRARTERVTYTVLGIGGDWRLDSRSLTDFPIISPQAYAVHTAMLQAGDDGLQEPTREP